MRTLTRGVIAIAGALLTAAPVAAANQESPGIAMELNKLEQREQACRVFLLLDNTTDHAFTELRLDLVFFAADGAIANRLAVNAAPLGAGKTVAKVFDIEQPRCGELSRVLFNGALACEVDGGDAPACTTSRGPARASIRASSNSGPEASAWTA